MGSTKQAEIERQDIEEARIRRPDWPRCIRCHEPVDYDLVELHNGKPESWPQLCSYCEHMSNKND